MSDDDKKKARKAAEKAKKGTFLNKVLWLWVGLVAVVLLVGILVW